MNTTSTAHLIRTTDATAAEADLIAWAAQGDAAAFEQLMRRHNRLLFRTARSILKNDQEAEDALQEAYLRAWKALAEFRAQARLSTWLVRIVANEALARRRHKTVDAIPLDAAMMARDADIQDALTGSADERPDSQAMRAQLRQLLEARIDLLPEQFRTVFMLRAVEDWSVQEVAQALDIPQATVATRYFRARSLLREGLASAIDTTLPDAFAFDGARCDRIVARVLARAGEAGSTPAPQ